MTCLRVIALLAVGLALGHSIPSNKTPRAPDMWIANIAHGNAAFNERPNDYKVYRNVMDFGCKGDGVTDDTACINTAISSGGRCGDNCGSSTIAPAVVYFPSGRYLISSPIIQYYFTQMVGNALDRPVLVAAPGFGGMAVIDSDPYLAGGAQWYTNQNNFFRQIRNFVIDLTQTPSSAATTGIHWQVAQATSLTNIDFKMTPGSNHQGIWMENGSGGFMSDLVFEGGKFGMWVGNQQFLSRNLVFRNCDTAIYINWNWQWSFKDVQISNSRVGIDISAPSEGFASGVGSLLLLDSTITDTPTGILVRSSGNTAGDKSGTVLLDNVRVTNVNTIVQDVNGGAILPGGSTTIRSWGRGSVYTDKSGRGEYKTGDLPNPPNKPAVLLDSAGKFVARSRPQYENAAVGDFASVRDFGAKGDGRSDDTDAIQNAINQSKNSKIVFFPQGNYLISRTVTVPGGTRITGEAWSVLMAAGAAFNSANNPQPMLKVGEVLEQGSVEISDVMFSTKGPQPGAILVQWNIRDAPGQQASAGMWDAHFRVGGYAGSELQVPQCPKGQGFTPNCFGAHTLLHVTTVASGYFENVWAWTGDHDLDNHLAQGQVTVYTGRGVNIESSQGPVWLYGTQSEHNVLYQYNLANANNVFMTMIQSETPYWQPGPPAPEPFPIDNAFNDPNYSHCPAGSKTCPLSWAVRATKSSNVYIYGAGLYNFFSDYDQTCLNTESCQDNMVNLQDNRQFYIYNLNTKAATNMVVANNNQILATQADNKNGFCQTVNAFLAEA